MDKLKEPQLVGVIEEFVPGYCGDFYYCQDGKSITLSRGVFYYLKALDRLKSFDGIDSLYNSEKDNIEKKQQILRIKYDQEILDTIAQERLKIHLLIDSPGGNLLELNFLLKILSILRKNQSQVTAFVKNAHSAAADLFLKTDRRYCYKDASFLWHKAEIDKDAWKSMEPNARKRKIRSKNFERKEQRKWHRTSNKLIYSATKNRADLRAKIKAAEADPNNKRCEVLFSGQELENFGIVQTCDCTRDLIVKFLEETGFIPEYNLQDPLSCFFLFPKIEEKVESVLNIKITVFYKDGILKYKCPKDLTEEEQKEIVKVINRMIRPILGRHYI